MQRPGTPSRPPKFAGAAAAYVHVPFCAHRCGYCDFTLVAGRDDLIDAYQNALAIELSSLGQPRPVRTLFFGGGTPSHLPPASLDRLLEMVARWLPLDEGGEFSLEANPSDITPARVNVLASRGVNRVSLGVQSFETDLLGTLERNHRREDVIRAVEMLQPQIPNVSLDLIFAVPGQTLSQWQQTLREAAGLQPAHISAYGLTFEKGTRFWSRREKGLLQQAPDELERSMYDLAMTELEDAGFAQYEISNYARPGLECRHNRVYWRGEEYLGFGPGAASYVGGERRTNHRSVTGWLKRIREGFSPVAETERLSPEDKAREALVLGLRMNEGVARREFLQRTGFEFDKLAGAALQRHVHAGWLEDTGDAVRLTREGRFVADSVIVDYL